MFKRSWVQIPAPYTWWTFFTLICCKNCIVCLKRPKINEKEAGVGPFLKRNTVTKYIFNDSKKTRLFLHDAPPPHCPLSTLPQLQHLDPRLHFCERRVTSVGEQFYEMVLAHISGFKEAWRGLASTLHCHTLGVYSHGKKNLEISGCGSIFHRKKSLSLTGVIQPRQCHVNAMLSFSIATYLLAITIAALVS